VDESEHRVEMHLASVGDQVIDLWGRQVHLRDGERIHTESCYKWSADELHAIAARAGLQAHEVFTDPRGWYAVHTFVVCAG
jgi:uncharacterized SAM-dependent methyltransferase